MGAHDNRARSIPHDVRSAPFARKASRLCLSARHFLPPFERREWAPCVQVRQRVAGGRKRSSDSCSITGTNASLSATGRTNNVPPTLAHSQHARFPFAFTRQRTTRRPGGSPVFPDEPSRARLCLVSVMRCGAHRAFHIGSAAIIDKLDCNSVTLSTARNASLLLAHYAMMTSRCADPSRSG